MSLLMLLSGEAAGGGGGGDPATATMFYEINSNKRPISQKIFTVSTNVTVWMYSENDSAIEFHKDGVKVGDATEDVGDPGWFSYTWATGAGVDYDVQLTAVGNVSGESDPYTVVIAETDSFTDNFTSWVNVDSCTITGGEADPDGGTGAYKIAVPASTNNARRIAISPTAFTINNWGCEIQWQPSAAIPCLQVAVGGYAANINGLTGETSGTYNLIKIIERSADGWVRFWVQRINRTSNPDNTVYITLCDTLGDATLTATAGSFIRLYAPRAANGTLPFTLYQKMVAYKSGTSGGIETYSWKHPICDTDADIDAAFKTIQVIKPTGWSASNTYKVMTWLPALTDAVETGAGNLTPSALCIAQDYANTYGCLIVIPHGLSGQPWYGKKSNNTADHCRWMGEVLPYFTQEFLSGSIDPEDNMLVGYSKSANATLSLMLLYPDRYGYGTGWDGKWRLDRDWATDAAGFGAVTAWTTQANFQNYDPYTLIPTLKAVISDKERFVQAGYYTFGADNDDMDALLTSEGVPHTYLDVLAAKHAWQSSWADPAVAACVALAGW